MHLFEGEKDWGLPGSLGGGEKVSSNHEEGGRGLPEREIIRETPLFSRKG